MHCSHQLFKRSINKQQSQQGLAKYIIRRLATNSTDRYVIGIRKEDKNCWERRAPLSPEHVRNLVQQGVDVVVQPSYIRCFSDEEYKEVRALFFLRLSLTTCTIFKFKIFTNFSNLFKLLGWCNGQQWLF